MLIGSASASTLTSDLKLRLSFLSFHNAMTQAKVNMRKVMDEKGKKIEAYLLPAKLIFEIRVFRNNVANFLEKNEGADPKIKKAHEDYKPIFHNEMVNIQEVKSTAEVSVTPKFWDGTLAFEKVLTEVLLKNEKVSE
ncbi:MAG: hypothetical protein CVV50_02450 [Spirochaetae bacterium HGW-Spirochaetae-6]|nr:MAG: hypothetical protein CVV50_02450 [Spirochaetae bacterium HGW-Spirochaetae-6]